MGKTGEKQIEDRNVREMKEGKDPPSFLPPPLIKIRVSNWSKLNFAFSFFFLSFYFFLFIYFLICFYSFYLFVFLFIFVALLALLFY